MKNFIFKNIDGKRQARNMNKFIEEELSLFSSGDSLISNVIMQCSNSVDYLDVVVFSKKIGNILSNNSFVFEQNLRSEEFLSCIDTNIEYLYGSDKFNTINIIFIANHSEYLSIVLLKDLNSKLEILKKNKSSLIFVMPDNFNPYIIGNPPFLNDIEVDSSQLEYLKDLFIFMKTSEYKPIVRKIDLRDTVSYDMGSSYYSLAFKELEQTKRWELVHILKINKKIIKEMILEGTLEESKINKDKMFDGLLIMNDFNENHNSFNPFKFISSVFKNIYLVISNFNKKIISYTMTIF